MSLNVGNLKIKMWNPCFELAVKDEDVHVD